MALTYDQMNAVTTKYFVKKITQQSYDSNEIFRRIAKGKRVKVVSGGMKVYHPIRYTTLDASSFVDPDSSRVVQNISTRTAFELDWTYLVVNMIMSWSEKIRNRGDAALIKLMDDKVQEAKDDVYKKFAEAFYQDQSSKTSLQLDGIYQVVQNPASGTTYAGVSSSDASDWKAGYFDNSTTTLSLFGSNSLEELIRSCTFVDGPDLILTTRKIAGIYASLLQPSERRQPGNGKTGATNDTLAFMGVPFLADPQCQAGDVIAVNTDRMWLYVQRGHNFTPKGWEEDKTRYYSDINMLSWVGNMVVDRRKNFGAFNGITS